MQVNRRLRLQLFFQNGLFVVLLIAAAALLAYLAHEYRGQWDLTQNHSNTLSPATLHILQQLKGPVTITAYATQHDPRLGDMQHKIRSFLAPYRHAKPDLTVSFIDPRDHPKLVETAGVTVDGEMVVDYDHRSEHLSHYTEEAFANTLMQLARGATRTVFFLDGHGERKLNGAANFDLGDFGKQLQNKGFKINSLNLGIAQQVPSDAAVLVIASPQVDLLPSEVAKIQHYVEHGGNLLWLIDSDNLHGLQPVAALLGLRLDAGTVVDLALRKNDAPPVMALAAAYTKHAITHNFHLNTVFPFAHRIAATAPKGWQVTPLIKVAQHGWLETGKLDDAPTFDRDSDVVGPINIASTFERKVDGRNQRVVVVGDGDFLSNTYLGIAGNLDLGINMVNWLAGDDNLITIQPRTTVDAHLSLDTAGLYLITFSLLVILPLIFVIAGAVIWWRRRRS